MPKDYEVAKRYEIAGVDVLSEIVSDKETPEYRAFHIRSSCPSRRWGTRDIGFSLTCYPSGEDLLETLEKCRGQQAEKLVKIESGEVPEKNPSFLGIQIQGPAGKAINAIASLDLSVAPSLISKAVIEHLELQPSAGHSFQEQLISCPLFAATINCGPLRVETVVTPSEHGSPACILGGDFFQKTLVDNEILVQELLMPDDARALASAARCKKRFVLIVGKYGEHRPRLERIKKYLSSQNLVGLLLDEYPDIEEQNLTEKLVTFASICRFVIADDPAPSSHIDELRICRELSFVTAVLRFKGRASAATQADITHEVSFMQSFSYTADDELERAVGDAARWADETVTERAMRLNRTYGDRRGPNEIVRA